MANMIMYPGFGRVLLCSRLREGGREMVFEEELARGTEFKKE